MRSSIRLILLTGLFFLIGACSRGDNESGEPKAVAQAPATEATGETAVAASKDPAIKLNPTMDAYFGNFHIHTSYSFDAYTNGSPTTPDDAYRWAQGEAIPGGGDGTPLQIKVPLDWYVVSDHAEYLGVFKNMENPDHPASKLEIAPRVTSDDQAEAFGAYSEVLASMAAGEVMADLNDPELATTVWHEVVETTEKYNQPGKFTTFPGFEWTSHPGDRNLHRVVVFETAENLPDIPFSALDSGRPEDLWTWMEAQRDNGATLFAVPHNGNASDGLMFPETTSYGGSDVNREYAEARMRNEPLYEVTQIKGTSETHPRLSPNDEFADFELWDYTLSDKAEPPEHKKGGYARDAFRTGLLLESQGKGNPFKYGLIGDSDTHNAASTVEEDNYTGKFGMENDPHHRLQGLPGFPEANNRQVREFSSGGLAGIWAKANTREELYAAMIRKETFATTGPRMKVRCFAGFVFPENLLDSEDWLETAYASGVPMGGDLAAAPEGKAPVFVIQAVKEADGANLDRLQVVKGWVEDGQTFEKIYDVALSDGRQADSNGNIPFVGNTVDATTATYTNDIGDAQLQVAWTDPDFDPGMHAFYYVRVLQIPTPRWSTYDAVKLGIPPRDDLPVSIQERAFTSPIWYTP